MAQQLKLYDYQQEAVTRLRSVVRDKMRELEGRRSPRVVLSAPTGAGKTEIATHLMLSAAAMGKRVAFLADRHALVEQTQARFDKYGLEYGILWSRRTRDTDRNALVVSTQTLEARGLEALDGDVDMIIIDECHELRRRTVKACEAMPNTLVIGLTATPLNPKLGKFYDGVVTVRTTADLMDEGILTPLRVVPVVPAHQVDTDDVDEHGGEWDEGQLGDKAHLIVGDAVDSWMKVRHSSFGDMAVCPTIGFFPTVKVCEFAASMFHARGVSAEVVSYRDKGKIKYQGKKITRQQWKIQRHQAREFEVLLCPAVLGRGYDDPGIRILIDAYPLMSSLITLIQRYGRVIRAFMGKDAGVVIDHAGNIKRLGSKLAKFWAQGIDELPKPRTKKEEQEEREQDDHELKPKDEELDPEGVGVGMIPGELEQSWTLDPSMIRRHAKATDEADAAKAAREYIRAPKGMTREDVWREVCGAIRDKSYLTGRSRLRAANGAYKSLVGSWRQNKDWLPRNPRPGLAEIIDHNYQVYQAERAAIEAEAEARAARWA